MMTSLDDTRYCPQCEAWANYVLDRDRKIARLQQRIRRLEEALYNSLHHYGPGVYEDGEKLIGKRRLAQLAKGGKASTTTS